MMPENTISHTDPIHGPKWPLALVVLGLGLTAAWTGVLGYGLVELVVRAL